MFNSEKSASGLDSLYLLKQIIKM